MKSAIRVVLIEDSENYRRMVSYILHSNADIELTSQFGTVEIALQSLEGMAEDELPNIILLDLGLPGLSGLDAVPLIKRVAPDAKILILTQSDKEADVLKAIRLGASGYLLKFASADKILEAIQHVHSGGATLDQNLARFILNKLTKDLSVQAHDIALSKREMEVLTLVAEGLVQKEIGEKLDISKNTVREYIQNIYGKLNVQNAPAAIAKAYRFGILPAGE